MKKLQINLPYINIIKNKVVWVTHVVYNNIWTTERQCLTKWQKGFNIVRNSNVVTYTKLLRKQIIKIEEKPVNDYIFQNHKETWRPQSLKPFPIRMETLHFLFPCHPLLFLIHPLVCTFRRRADRGIKTGGARWKFFNILNHA